MGHIHYSWDYPMGHLNDGDVAIEVVFPLFGPHRFRHITAFLTLYFPFIAPAVKAMLWDMEVRDVVRQSGVVAGLVFEQDMYSLGMNPNTFIADLGPVYVTLPFRYFYYALDLTFAHDPVIAPQYNNDDTFNLDVDLANPADTEE